MLISNLMTTLIWEQISHEQYNSNLYLQICGFLRNKGLENLAKKFEKQYQEEIEHAKNFVDFLTDMSADVKIKETKEVSEFFETIPDIAKIYLDKEILTTNSINSLKQIAIEEDNAVAEEFMREMIRKQHHEYKEATEFFDKASIVGEDWKATLLWDLSEGR